MRTLYPGRGCPDVTRYIRSTGASGRRGQTSHRRAQGAALLVLALAGSADRPAGAHASVHPAQQPYYFNVTYVGKGQYRRDTHYVCSDDCGGNNGMDHFQAAFSWKVSYSGIVAPVTAMTFMGATMGGTWTETGQIEDAATANRHRRPYVRYSCGGRLIFANHDTPEMDGVISVTPDRPMLLSIQAPNVETDRMCRQGGTLQDPYWHDGMRSASAPITLTADIALPRLAYQQGKIIQLVDPGASQLPARDCSIAERGAIDRTICTQSLSWHGTVTFVASRNGQPAPPVTTGFGVRAVSPPDGATNVAPGRRSR